MPDTIQFSNGNQIINRYAADGRKLGTEYFTRVTNLAIPLTPGSVIKQTYTLNTINQNGTAYIDNKEYSTLNGNASLTALKRVYNAEGYAENSTSTNPIYNYYRKDHLGNIREVNTYGSSSPFNQRTQYYPSGLPWAYNSDDNPGFQTRKYNGKEFIEMHGLDTYDYGARGYYPAMGRFMIVDPLAEDYYETSPYAYGLNNPMRYTDPTGMSVKDTTVNLPPVEVKASRYSPIGTRAMEPVNGVGDWLSYLAFGRTYNWDPKTLGISLLGNNTYRVDYNGIIVGAQPLMGEPPIPTFTGGSIFIKGLNYVDKLKFHRVFKPQILKEAKKMLDFTRIVGKNPDIVIESGEIILKGTGEFSKQSFSTGLKAIDFFK